MMILINTAYNPSPTSFNLMCLTIVSTTTFIPLTSVILGWRQKSETQIPQNLAECNQNTLHGAIPLEGSEKIYLLVICWTIL